MVEARIGSAFFTPRNNLVQLRNQIDNEESHTPISTLNYRNLKFL